MGLGGIIGTVLGAATGQPWMAGVGGVVDGLTNKPKKPGEIPYTDPGKLPNYDIGIDYGTGPRVKAPNLPGDMPNLPNNMPVLPQAKMFGATAGESGAMDATKAMSKLYAAMLDPNNPIMKNQVDAEEQLIQNDFLSGLKESINQNRRQQARGRRGFMNPERMDEQVTGAVTKNAQQARLLARLKGFDNLNKVASGVGNVASQYGKNALLEGERRDDYRTDLKDRLNQIRGDIMTRLGNTRGDISTSVNNSREDIQNALNLYHGATGNAQQATQTNNTNTANYQGATSDYYSNITKQLGDLLKGGSGGSSFLDALKYMGS